MKTKTRTSEAPVSKERAPRVREVPRKPPQPKAPVIPPFETEMVLITDLKPHPRNYRQHPDDQREHISASITEHGFYKNVVVARDNTILAGHGVTVSAARLGLTSVPVIRLPIDPNDPRALKVLTGDNELARLAEIDDRGLTEILKGIMTDSPTSLMGTGYDQGMLAALVMVSRPASEIANINEAAEYIGMPGYEDGVTQPKLTITFKNVEDRERFKNMAKLTIDKIAGMSWSTRWPFTEREDASSIRFEVAE